MLGLATDYCVKFTALDALQLGFRTRLVVDGCRAVNLAPDDDARAIDAMKAAGVEIVESAEVWDARTVESRPLGCAELWTRLNSGSRAIVTFS